LIITGGGKHGKRRRGKERRKGQKKEQGKPSNSGEGQDPKGS